MPPKGGKKPLKAARQTKATLELNEDKGGGAIHLHANLAEVHAQSQTTLMGEKKQVPEWMKDGASQKDKDILCDPVFIYTPDGKTELIMNARVQFVYGRRYGLIGPNGKGKTTLIRHIAEYNDAILPGFPKHLRVVHVAQHADIASDGKVLEHVVASDEERAYLDSEQERILQLLEEGDDDEVDPDELNEQLERIDQRLDAIDARRAEIRATAILSGLGFTAKMQQSNISSLSGGWRQRVALACALFVAPDILLLDEPTNHLDFPSVTWLTAYLKNVSHTLLVVSHDRDFLNSVITDVIDLTEKQLLYYRGDYENYLKRREEAWTMRKRLYENQQKKIAELKEFINEAQRSDNPGIANQVPTRQRMLEKLQAEAVPEPVEVKNFRFQFPVPGKLDHDLVAINKMSFSYFPNKEEPEKSPMLLKDITLNMDQTSRVGVLGVNGAGKSTLIKLIRGKLDATLGTCRVNPHARHVLFTQHHIDQLDLTKNSLDFLQARFPTAKEHQIRGVMGRFGFDQNLIMQKISTLSGGQRSRVAFAVLTWEEPHLIIMDEPTNHLDLETIEALIHALNGFKGGVLLISHDRHFIENVAKEYWAVNLEGHIQVFHELEDAKDYAYPMDLDFTMTKKGSLPVVAGSSEDPRPKQGDGSKGKKKSRPKKEVVTLSDVAEVERAAELEHQRKVEELKRKLAEEAERERDEAFKAQQEAAEAAAKAEKEAAKAEKEAARAAKEAKKREKEERRRAAERALFDEEDDQASGDSAGEDASAALSKLSLKDEKKKKKKKDAEEEEEEEEEEDDEAERKRRRKEKKERKRREEEEGAAEDSDDDKQKKRKKKKKRDEEEDEEEEPASDKKKRDKKKKKKQDDSESEEEEEESPKKKDRKKKKKKSADSDDDDEEEAPREKKRKKKKSVSSEDDEEEETTKRKDKKKKKKKADSDEEEEEDGSESDSDRKKRKKKKKKSKSVEDDEDEEEAAPASSKDRKKKKKKRRGDSDDDEEEPAADSEESTKKKRKEKKKKRRDASDEEEADSDEEEEEDKKKKKKKRRDKKSKQSDDDKEEAPVKEKKEKRKKRRGDSDEDEE